MEDERSVRVPAGCAILFLFDLIALCALLYIALVAGPLFLIDCATGHERECSASRAAPLRWLAGVFLTTLAVNVGFLPWGVRRPRRGR